MADGTNELNIQIPPEEVLVGAAILMNNSQASSSSQPHDNTSPVQNSESQINTSMKQPADVGYQAPNNYYVRKTIEKMVIVVELGAFRFIMVLLIAGFSINRLQNYRIWDLKLWRWCLLISTIFCGRVIGYLFTEAVVFFIWKFRIKWLDEKSIYFAYRVKKSIIVFIWFLLVFLAWALFFDRGVTRSNTKTNETVNDVTRGLAGCLIGAALWLVKTVLVELVASLHVTKLFEKIREANYHRNVLIALSRKEVLKEDKMDGFMDAIRAKNLPPLTFYGDKEVEETIKNEQQAKKAANHIFKNLAYPNDEKYMDLEKILKYARVKEMADQCQTIKEVGDHFQAVAEDRQNCSDKQIKRSIFRKWAVSVYNNYDSLNSALRHRKTAVDELNKLASVVILVTITIVWLLFMEFLTTKAIVFLSSQLLLVVFMFGNTAKLVFEAIIFVFVMHPFDVGDRCVIDGTQMVVEEMQILTTIFLKNDGEKIYYPNSVLATKPISNLYRSPPMTDSVEFAIDLYTSDHKITDLKYIIKEYLKSNPRRWKPAHSLQFKEIENMNKMKMVLYFNHTISFHDFAKRGQRRSELVLHLKTVFQILEIKYNLLPQQVHVTYSGSMAQ